MNREELFEKWAYEEQQPFTGWDFSYLDGRMVEDQPPWSYLARAAVLMQSSTVVLDMGTGGGERLLALRESWPDKVVVTEDYAPNVKVAQARLGPWGVAVVNVPLTREGGMPFKRGSFDLVLNRHSGLNSAEVERILRPGGIFLTQQIHGLWAQDLLAAFGAEPQWPDATPAYYVPRLEAAGMRIAEVDTWTGALKFYDVGAIVYYLKAVPWLVPGFSVAKHRDTLLKLAEELQRRGVLVYEARKYWIEAQKTT